jgi:ribose-phosphate pyrophosphokinase
MDKAVLFALEATRPFGERVARRLGVELGAHEERDFEDGEHKIRPLVGVRGKNVYAIQSLHADDEESVNDRLCRFLFFLGALKDASAASVTAVVPYFAYARKDRRTKPRDPVTTRYVAGLFEAVGTDRVVTLDVHNLAAFENSFRIRTEHLQAMPLFVEHFAPIVSEGAAVVISPDVGGAKRAKQFAEALERAVGGEMSTAFVEKHRSGGVVTGGAFAGEVEGRTAIIIDDLISSGGTILRAANACRKLGANEVYAAATHGIFVGKAGEVLVDDALEQVVVTDTIPPFRLEPAAVRDKLVVLDSTALFAEAIRRIEEGGSITDLVEV